MPIIFKKNIEGGWLALWQITESEEALRKVVSASDIASCAAMRSPKRRIERLAWRALLRELLPGAGEVRYDDGAPKIDGGYIGVSHCKGCAALIFRTERPCSIDIEPADRDVSRAAGRMALPAESIEEWCAHEARHKYGDLTANVHFLHEVGLCIAYI